MNPAENLLSVGEGIGTAARAWNAIRENEATRDAAKKPENGFTLEKLARTPHMSSARFQHYYKGLEVVGSVAIHQTANATGESSVLDRIARIDISAEPRISADEAASLARSLMLHSDISSKPELKILPEPSGSNAKLVYWIAIRSVNSGDEHEVVIDANSGQILSNVSENLEIAPVHAAKPVKPAKPARPDRASASPIEVYSAKGRGFQLMIVTDDNDKPIGCIVTDLSNDQPKILTLDDCMNAQPQDLTANPCQAVVGGDPIDITLSYCDQGVKDDQATTTDPAMIRAQKNSEAVLEYYASKHQRKSYDDQGSKLISVVHAGLKFNNAFWNTKTNMMAYGDGDGTKYGDFTQALDVAGHEMTHGVVNATAKLLMSGESGALNEATADFFGKMIENKNDWVIGKEVFVNPKAAGGIRNIANPGALQFCAAYDDKTGACSEKKGYPANVKDQEPAPATCDITNDNCWVHVNSTIHSHALYLMVQSIGKDKAEALYYTTLTHALTARDGLASAAAAVKHTCDQMYDSGTCAQVKQAFVAVGE